MEQIKQNSVRAWILAARPKTLTGAATPVLIGTSLAIYNHCFDWIVALECLLFAFFMQIAANLINDLFDFLKGSDREDRLGPERACAQGWISPQAMKYGIILVLNLACSVGLPLLFISFNYWLIAVGALCVVFAFLYTTGPYPLSYHGWGDVLVLVFFGFVPVGCTYIIQCGVWQWTWQLTFASLASGLVIDTLLVINNYRDREADARSGKKTIIVRFGEKFGSGLYYFLGVMATACYLLSFSSPALLVYVFALFYLFLHTGTWLKMKRIHSGKKLNSILGETSRNMLFIALLYVLASFIA